MEFDIETTTALAKTFYTPLRQHSVLSGQRLPSKFTQLPSKAPDQAKNISHSTPDGLWNFLVQILCGGSVIGHTTDPAPAPIASKEPEKGKRYFGLYLLVGGRKPYTIWNPIYCKDSWRDYPLP